MDPIGQILAPGGQIFVARHSGTVIGTCAVLPIGGGVSELLKFAVARSRLPRIVPRAPLGPEAIRKSLGQPQGTKKIMRAIELRMLDQPELAELSEAPERYAATQGLVLTPHADLLQAVARQTRKFVQQGGITAPWGGYLAVDPLTRVVVGTCAFKGPPDMRGEVEVAYFTFPTHEGQGYATAMARALCDRAGASTGVERVRAHTLPERNASARVLEKLGFRWDGDVQDPEDGPVWRWVWQVPSRRSSAPASA